MQRPTICLLLISLAGCGLPNHQAAPQSRSLSIADEFNKNKPSETEATAMVGYDRSNETKLESFLESIVFEVGREELVPTLREHLRGKSKPHQILAAAALIRHGTDTDAALGVLIAALEDPDEWVARYAAQILPRLRPASLPAIEPLAKASNRSDSAAQSAAIAAASFGLPAVPHLIKALEQQDPSKSQWTTLGLSEVGPLAVPALIEALAHKNWFVRWGAAEALGQTGLNATSAGPAMIPLLRDEVPQVRSTAANALQRMNAHTPEVVSALLDAAKDPDVRVRSCVAVALGVLGKQDQRVGPALLEMTSDPVPDVRHAAAVGLKELGSASASLVPRYLEMLENQPAHVRRVAISGLGKAGPAAKEAWPKLLELYHAAPEQDQYDLAEAMLRIDAESAEQEGITWETLNTRFPKNFAPPPKR